MKALILLIALASVWGQEIEDLGVVSGRRGIVLEKCERRKDFNHFKIELQSGTFHDRFTTTNEVLGVADFARMPAGPVLIAVVSVCGDGAESELALFRVTVARGAPDRSRARPVLIATNSVPQTLTNALAIKQEFKVQNMSLPPLPPPPKRGMSGLPLPNGTNRTYSERR